MVSPLQTWHHHEPKGLWAGLSGLAVVAHIGILGFSLPYLLRITQPIGEGFTAIAPIELIEVDAKTSFKPTETTSQTSQSPATEAINEASEADAASSSVNRPAALSATGDSATATSPPIPGDTVGSPPEQRPITPTTPRNASPNNEQGSNRSEGGSTQTPSEPGSEDSDVGDEESNGAGSPTTPGSSEDPPGSTSSPGSSGESSGATPNSPPDSDASPPVIPGNPSLPEPSSTPGEVSDNQRTYLSVTSHGYVPESLQRDLVDTPPELIYGGKTSLEANPVDLGCGQVDFSLTQATYRVTIGADGALLSAIPWTNSIEAQPMSSSERAIACLLESADFSFTPALQDGSPVANSNLLLTIEVIESGVN